MNIALGALILILLLLPAISFKFGIRQNTDLGELLETQSITDSFWAFLFIPIFINIITLSFVHYFFGEIKFNLLFKLIIGDKDFIIQNEFFFYDILWFLLYTMSCLILGYFLGRLIAYFDSRWSFISNILGLEDNWMRLTDLETMRLRLNKNIDVIYLDILTNNKENTVVYSGILSEFYFKSKSKEIDYILLSNVYRRDLHKEHITEKSDSKEIRRFDSNQGNIYPIPGDFFVIPRDQILNVNFRYMDLTFQKSNESIGS